MREMPTLCSFLEIQKKDVIGGSKALYVFLSDKKNPSSSTLPPDFSSLTPTQLSELPNFAGSAALFIFNEGSAHCVNCTTNVPTVTVSTDVTEALRTLGLTKSTASVHVIVYDVYSLSRMERKGPDTHRRTHAYAYP